MQGDAVWSVPGGGAKLACTYFPRSFIRTAHSGGEYQIPVQVLESLVHVSGRRGVRAHALNVCRDTGAGALAVNGIIRREVVCVLDEYGRGQVFDLSQDQDEEEMEEGEREGEGEGDEDV